MEEKTPTRTSLRTMWLALLVYHLSLIIHSQAQNACLTNPTFREPVNSDITVKCGTQRMELSILLCPVYFGGYNESLMALNAQFNKLECRGSPDWTVNPPVLKFNFSITEEAISACSNHLKISQEVGSGLFSDYSSVQFVNISGMINSIDPAAGTITYRQEMMYVFSCRYPLQYLLNNTEMSVSGVSLAVKDSNGSFISTLSMHLYEDSSYSTLLVIPSNGLRLKKRIFVEVRATNLTERFNVLLDRCYATTNPIPANSSSYDLFVGCNRDGQTVMGVNGQQQSARFSFEAFRFVEHKNMTISTFYLHCATRLCDKSICSSLRPNCSASARRKREVQSSQGTTVSDMATVSSGPIITKVDNGEDTAPKIEFTLAKAVSMVTVVDELSLKPKDGPLGFASQDFGEDSKRDGSLLAVGITVAIVGTLCISAVAFAVYRVRSSKKGSKEKSVFHQ